jgi:hypothetical protein
MTDIAVCAVAIKNEGNNMQLYSFCHYDLTSTRQNFIYLSICLSVLGVVINGGRDVISFQFKIFF